MLRAIISRMKNQEKSLHHKGTPIFNALAGTRGAPARA